MRPLTVPPGVAEAQALTSAIDDALAGGLARLSPETVGRLSEVAAALHGSPLGEPLMTAIEKLAAGELLAHHLAVLAASRAALEGARADALLAEVADAAGLVLERPEHAPPPAPSEAARIRMESARQWLVEIALAGFEQLDGATLVPVFGTLTGIQERPELQGLAALLTGFAGELMDSAPTSQLPSLPKRRWADLWSHCLLASVALPSAPTTREVSGIFRPLGGDLRHHDHFASLVVHGLFEEKGGPRRLVRTTISAWKVEAIVEAEIWNLLTPLAPSLIEGLAKPRSVGISGAALSSAGDLRWDGAGGGAEPFDPFSAELEGAILSAPTPRSRHPLQIAVPAVISGPSPLPLDPSRVSPHLGLTEDEVQQSEALIGLVRFDDQWALQPLCGRKGKKVFGPAEQISFGAKVKRPALATLKERASKLLRAS